MTSPALFEEEDGVITHNGRMFEPDATIVRFEILQIGILIVHRYHVRYSLDNRNVVCYDTGPPGLNMNILIQRSAQLKCK